MNTEITEAALLYVTDRTAFNAQHENSLHQEYLDMLFLGASTRPDLAEQLPVLLCGGVPSACKHGVDGTPGESERYIEVKVSTTDTQRPKRQGSVGNLTINDPSQSIIDKYDELNPLFIFPLFVDGHLLVIFKAEWTDLRHYYVDGIAKIHERNQQSTAGRAATRNFSMTTAKWLPHATVAFVNTDQQVVKDLMSAVGTTKNYRSAVEDYLI